MKKNIIGTNIILKVYPTKSAAASKIAIEITSDLHMQSIAVKYKKATTQMINAKIFIQYLEELFDLYVKVLMTG